MAIEIHVDENVRRFPQEDTELYGPAEQLLEALAMTTPLPWSGLTPADYPQDPNAIIELEREAGRLPHQRLEHS